MNNHNHVKRLGLHPEKALAFFQGFLREPQRVGSVVPSSRFLERRLVKVGKINSARLVVELGPGTGGTTEALLRALPDDARLLAIEIDPYFARMLRTEVDDPRLIVHEGSAEEVAVAIERHRLSPPEVVVSGIPFSTMPSDVGESILRSVWTLLAPGGRFVAYQFRNRVSALGRDILGYPEIDMEFFNVPPSRVYCGHKPC